MNHLFLILQQGWIDWLLLIGSFVIVVFLYFREEARESRQVHLLNKAWKTVFIGVLPVLGLLVEFILFKNVPFRSVAYDLTIILRLATIGIPILFCVLFISSKRGLVIVAALGLVYSIFITHSLWTCVELLIIYSVAEKKFFECNGDVKGFFVRSVSLILAMTPYIFLVSLMMYPSASLAVRFDFAFSVGWYRWLAYVVSLAVSGLMMCLVTFLKQRFLNTEDESNEPFLEERLTKTIILYFAIGLFLFATSAFWNFRRHSFLQTIETAADDVIDSMVIDYFYFFDIGKALIQSHAAEISNSTEDYSKILPELINKIPFFSQLEICQEGKLVASYPENTQELLSKELFHPCAGVMNTDPLLRLERTENSTIYVFSTGIDEDTYLVAMTTLDFAPQFSQYIASMNKFSTYWQMTDGFGGVYLSDSRPYMIQKGAYEEGYHRVIPITDGPIVLEIQQVYSVEAIASTVAQGSLSSFIFLFLIHLSLYFLLLFFYNVVNRNVTSTIRSLSALANFEFEEVQRQRGGFWFGLRSQVQSLASSLEFQTGFMEKGLDVVDMINEIETFSELKEIIHHETFLQNIGKMTLVMDPELEFAGRNQSNVLYTSHFKALANRVESEGYDPFVLENRNNSENNEFISVLYPLEHDGDLLGFLVVLVKERVDIRPHQERFLLTFTKSIAASIFHRLKRTVATIVNERIDFLVRSYPAPIMVIDRNLNLVMISDTAKELPGVIGEQAGPGIPLRRFIRDKSLLQLLSEAEAGRNMSSRVKLSNRREYLVTVVAGEDQEVHSDGWVLISLQDITQYKEQEQIRTELFETVAQYLQMPIKMTRGNLKMLSMVGPLNDSQKTYSNNMESSINDIDSFVKQMLDRNRLENPANYDMQVVSLDQLLKDAVDRIIPYTKQQNVSIYLERTNDQHVRQIEIDPQLFTQAIYSLLENSVQNNHVGGEVEITIEEQPDSYVVCIADSGPGISAVDVNRIFVDPSVLELHGESPRISLGVQLAKSIIERHSGEIWVKSKLGKGSQFYLRIPRFSSTKVRNSNI